MKRSTAVELPAALIDAAAYGLRFGAEKQGLHLNTYDVEEVARCVLMNALGHGVILWTEHDAALAAERERVYDLKNRIGAIRADADRQVTAMARERDAAYERLRALDEDVPDWWAASRPKPVKS